MRKLRVPLKEYEWVQKWYVDVHNIASSTKLDYRNPLEIIEGFTHEISKFCFHIWEPIC